jgi:hypothetical protein
MTYRTVCDWCLLGWYETKACRYRGNSPAGWDVRDFPVVQPVGAGPLGRFRDATTRKSSLNGSGVATAIPLDRHRDGAAVLQQLGDADKHIAAGEMTGATA